MTLSRTGTWVIAVSLAAMGCKEPARAVPPAPAKDASITEAVEASKPVHRPNPGKPNRDCDPDHVKSFVEMREEVEAMRPLVARAMLARTHLEFIDGIRDAARRRAFGELAGVIDGTVDALTGLDRGGNIDITLEKSVEMRVGAYATCMSLADDDISWCTSLDEEWTGSRVSCQVMYTVLRRIAVSAVREGGDCASVMAGSPEIIGLGPDEWISMCQAVKENDPGKCPTGIDKKTTAMCRSAAAHDGREHCRKLGGEHSAIWEPCCNQFGYRVKVVVHGKAPPGMSPEMDALGGDGEGCERSLVWRLFQDTAQVVGIEGAPPSPVDAMDSKEYECRFKVFHAPEKLPGQ